MNDYRNLTTADLLTMPLKEIIPACQAHAEHVRATVTRAREERIERDRERLIDEARD